MAKWLFTSESVTEGHPDKMADQISDAILDAILAKDPAARVACEVCLTTGLVLVAGEITCDCYVDIPSIVRETIREIGYVDANSGFDANTCAVLTAIDEQSPDIAAGVNEAWEVRTGQVSDAVINGTGAGDQGIMFGYATNETEVALPLPIYLAHGLTRRLAEVRKKGELPYLRPDGKAQVTVEYEGDTPRRVTTVVVSAQHQPDVDMHTLTSDIIEHVVKAVIPAELLTRETRYLVNPTGRFVVGGPLADTGLTGRKTIVDTYGGMARNGGGSLSGKDPTKVDRSATYAARYVAKNIVAAGLARRCEVQVAYAIGVARPVSVTVDTFGTGVIEDEALTQLVVEHFDLRPAAIIRDLNLRRPIYKPLAAYGHFGRVDLNLSWEVTDKAAILRQAAGG